MTNIKVYKNKKQAYQDAAQKLIEIIKKKPNAVIGLATGSTSAGFYQCLVEDYQKNKTDYSKVITFNLDEYYDVDEKNPISYRYFMNEQFFCKVNIDLKNTYFPKNNGDKKLNSENYEKLINQHGPFDFQLLGLGVNGHIAFNEPGSTINQKTHVVNLKKETIAHNAKIYFDNKEELVPKKAITMGISTILKAKYICLLAFGKEKKLAIDFYKTNQIDANWPVSFLHTHNNCEIYIDELAN